MICDHPLIHPTPPAHSLWMDGLKSENQYSPLIQFTVFIEKNWVAVNVRLLSLCVYITFTHKHSLAMRTMNGDMHESADI